MLELEKPSQAMRRLSTMCGDRKDSRWITRVKLSLVSTVREHHERSAGVSLAGVLIAIRIAGADLRRDQTNLYIRIQNRLKEYHQEWNFPLNIDKIL